MTAPEATPADRLAETIARIRPVDPAFRAAAIERHDRLTKPQGSLGRLEQLAAQLAAIQGRPIPRIEDTLVVVAAGDHGVAAGGVSAFPQSVTGQMVANFAAGGAAINVLARNAGARLVVLDAGTASDGPAPAGVISRRVRAGTRDFRTEPALTRDEAVQAIVAGIETLEGEAAGGLDLVATGEMGIGNTTAAAAITSAILGLAPELSTGRGTGIDDERWRFKCGVVRDALALHQLDPSDGLAVLAALGGLEIGALAGVIIAAAAARIPVLLDGFITGAAALVADRIAPGVRPYLIAAHRSVEPGHTAILEELGLEPLLDLGLRLGEGSGAALAIPVVRAAARILAEMATFDSAGVSGATG